MASRGRPQDLRGVIDERFREVWERIKELERPDWGQLVNANDKMIAAATKYQGEVAFTIDGTTTLRATAKIVVPEGFSRALVTCTTHLNVNNTSGSKALLILYTYIEGEFASLMLEHAAASSRGSVASSWARDLAVTPGQEITAAAMCSSDVTLSAANSAYTVLTAVFLR